MSLSKVMVGFGGVRSTFVVSIPLGDVLPEGSVTVAVTVRTPLFGISSAGISTSTFPFLISSAVNTLVTSGRPSPSVSTFRTSPALASFGNVIVAVTPAAISSAFNNSSPPSLITTVGALMAA